MLAVFQGLEFALSFKVALFNEQSCVICSCHSLKRVIMSKLL